MKYIILVLGILLISILLKDHIKEGGLARAVPIFFWMLYIIIWLIVFYVFGLELPKVTL